MATEKRVKIEDFNLNNLVEKFNKNTCIILAQCLYLGHSIEWANSVNEISEALDNNLTLSDLNKIINVEEGVNYLGFERKDRYLCYTGCKNIKNGTKLILEIEKEDIFRETDNIFTSNFNEYTHTPFVLSMAIFLKQSIEWATMTNEATRTNGMI